jgi:DNA-binding MarR family transcriptional regulator
VAPPRRRAWLRMSDLASRVVLSPSGVTWTVDQLERKGLVERCDSRVLSPSKTSHLSRTELEHLATTLQAVLDGERSPLPPPNAS